jgi:hypothetical protein
MRRILVATVATMLASAPTGAKTVATPPFPVSIPSAGLAACQATNVGTKEGTLLVEMLDNTGAVLETEGPKPVAPGATPGDVLVEAGGTTYPTWCRFTYTGRFKASYYWNSGASFVLVPAEK